MYTDYMQASVVMVDVLRYRENHMSGHQTGMKSGRTVLLTMGQQMNFRSISGQFPVSESIILVTHTLEIGKIGIDDDKECNCFARCIFLSLLSQYTKYTILLIELQLK